MPRHVTLFPGAICGRSMNDGADHCGMPRLHRSRCAAEPKPETCAMCPRPMPCTHHEGCCALGFDRHQDVVTVKTTDDFGVHSVTKCRRCNAGFGSMYRPHTLAAS